MHGLNMLPNKGIRPFRNQEVLTKGIERLNPIHKPIEEREYKNN